MKSGKNTRCLALLALGMLFGLVAMASLSPIPGHAQAPLSAEDARFIEFGKEIFKSKAVCQYCHKCAVSFRKRHSPNRAEARNSSLNGLEPTSLFQ